MSYSQRQSTSIDEALNLCRPLVWSIASSDCSGHAGSQADLKTFSQLDCHGSTLICATTAQNSLGLLSVNPVSEQAFTDQLQALADDTLPSAIKIGLLPTRFQLHTVIDFLQRHSDIPVILDPVLGSSTGGELTQLTAEALLSLLPVTTLFTPNLVETEALLGCTLTQDSDIQEAAMQFHGLGAQGVLIKGGHGEGEVCKDWLSIQEPDGTLTQAWLIQPKLAASHLRGTGCTLSSAVAAFVAQGERLRDAVTLANAYVHAGILQGYQAGQGPGPIGHGRAPTQFEHFPTVVDQLGRLTDTAFADCGHTPLGLYPVVDSVEWLRKLLPLGITTAQLRIKDCPAEQLEQHLKDAIALGREYQCRLFINDYWQLAIKLGAYGVHLGQEDIDTADLEAIKQAGLRLGISTHGDFEWARAASLKPSYLAIGAVFPTDTKTVHIVGLDALQRWVSILKPHYPVTAIGGINLARLSGVLDTGIDSVAVVSAITAADDYKDAVNQFQKALKKEV